MPIYEYQCNKCSRIYEIWQKINEKPPEKCPDCSGPLHKLVSLSSFQLKGTGWYVDGYANVPAKEENRTKNKPTEKVAPGDKKKDGKAKIETVISKTPAKAA